MLAYAQIDSSQTLATPQVDMLCADARTAPLRAYIEHMGGRHAHPLPLKTLKKFFPFLQGDFPTIDALMEKFQMEFYWHHKDGQKLRWSKSDQQIFMWATVKVLEEGGPISPTIVQLPQITNNQWNKVSQILGVDVVCLQKQWQALQKKSVRTQHWSGAEDKIVKNQYIILSKKGTVAWKEIADEIFARLGVFRTSRQVRARWFNFVDPQINKDYWSPSEDKKLLTQIARMGKKWSVIADMLRGRNYNQVKNRFNSLVKKYILKAHDGHRLRSKLSDKELAQQILNAYQQQMKVCEAKNPLAHLFGVQGTQARADDESVMSHERDDECEREDQQYDDNESEEEEDCQYQKRPNHAKEHTDSGDSCAARHHTSAHMQSGSKKIRKAHDKARDSMIMNSSMASMAKSKSTRVSVNCVSQTVLPHSESDMGHDFSSHSSHTTTVINVNKMYEALQYPVFRVCAVPLARVILRTVNGESQSVE